MSEYLWEDIIEVNKLEPVDTSYLLLFGSDSLEIKMENNTNRGFFVGLRIFYVKQQLYNTFFQKASF